MIAVFGGWCEGLFRKSERKRRGVRYLTGYRLEVGSLSDAGCCRPINQDHIGFVRFAEKNELLSVVADGMGGHRAGEIASRLAIEAIQQHYGSLLERFNLPQVLEKAFAEANKAIYRAAQQEPEQRGMGTTLVALAVQKGRGYYANVGDSRLYLIRNGESVQLSRDHTVVAELVKDGLITVEAAKNHPDQSVITRAVGTHTAVAVDVCDEPVPLQIGDRFMLCSDGLYDLVEESEIEAAVSELQPQEACQQLVQLAKERGGHDNISVIVIEVESGDLSVPNKETPVTRS